MCPVRTHAGKEKELAAGAKLTVALVYDADVSPLRGSVPVEVAASEWEEVAEELDDLFIGDAEVWRRSVRGLTDPRGGSEPYVTPRGNYVLDLLFEERGGEGARAPARARSLACTKLTWPLSPFAPCRQVLARSRATTWTPSCATSSPCPAW